MEALKEYGECNSGFQPCLGSPMAKVNTVSKGNMPVWRSPYIEVIWIGKLCLVTVGGTDPGQHHLTRLDLMVSDGDIRNSSAIHVLYRRAIA